jgi:hypothetical protein
MEYLNGSVAYGYTISDDNDMSFDNNAEAMIEDDMELLKYTISTADSSTEDMLDFVRECEKGMDINDNWYDWEEIKEVLSI